MITTVFRARQADFVWIDVVDPTAEELAALDAEYGLPDTAVQDCLDPKHLPKYEDYGDVIFVITRAYDEHGSPRAATTQDLTRKIAVFYNERFLLSVHRKDQTFIAALRDRFAKEGPALDRPLVTVGAALLKASLLSYAHPLEEIEKAIERYEGAVFGRRARVPQLEQLFVLKRRAGLMNRMLLRLREVVIQAQPHSQRSAPVFQDLRETADAMQFRAELLVNYLEGLLNLQVALSSHRTNEVMRILTLFSAIFMPITFIVGVYGMNFHYMPELGWRYGYAATWLVILATTGGILVWFARRGWLR